MFSENDGFAARRISAIGILRGKDKTQGRKCSQRPFCAYFYLLFVNYLTILRIINNPEVITFQASHNLLKEMPSISW